MDNIARPGFQAAPFVKPLINIGCCLDIPSGYYVEGKYGESILNGGLGAITGVVGEGNRFKSTILHYMMLSAAEKIFACTPTFFNTYDTEMNIHQDRLMTLASGFFNLVKHDIVKNGWWNITDKTIYYANEWFEILKKFLKDKQEDRKNWVKETPFLDRDRKTLLKMLVPTFSEIDSFTEFETAASAKIMNENEIGDSGGNTLHMRQGLDKTRFIMEIPKVCMSANDYMLLTAHVGKEIQMASGPVAAPPTKQLMDMKMGDKVKGASGKFFFLTSNCWQTMSVSALVNQGTKGSEYPENSDDNIVRDVDLRIVTLKQLRGKSGPSGAVIEVIVSQAYGVLPELTEFHYIKSQDRFGISGSLHSYSLDLLPDVKLSRTTVRSKIAENSQLRRALGITSELCQMKQYWRKPNIVELMCSPKELYDDIKALGYDWDILLNTRSWWTLENDKQPIPFLSTMDLCKMRRGLYFPYWLEDDKKTIKKQFLNTNK